jgi:hypothetical protein
MSQVYHKIMMKKEGGRREEELIEAKDRLIEMLQTLGTSVVFCGAMCFSFFFFFFFWGIGQQNVVHPKTPKKKRKKKRKRALTSLSFEKLGEREGGRKKKDLQKEQHEMKRVRRIGPTPNPIPPPLPFPSLSPTQHTPDNIAETKCSRLWTISSARILLIQ